MNNLLFCSLRVIYICFSLVSIIGNGGITLPLQDNSIIIFIFLFSLLPDYFLKLLNRNKIEIPAIQILKYIYVILCIVLLLLGIIASFYIMIAKTCDFLDIAQTISTISIMSMAAGVFVELFYYIIREIPKIKKKKNTYQESEF
jgi:hypothetical protein